MLVRDLLDPFVSYAKMKCCEYTPWSWFLKSYSLCKQNISAYCESKGGFAEHLGQTSVAQQCVKIGMTMIVINLVTPKAAAKQELLFNKSASSVYNGFFYAKK